MKLTTKTIFIIGILQCTLLSYNAFSTSKAVEPPRGDGYSRILDAGFDTSTKFQYLRNYHAQAQSCYVDASVLAVQYYYDNKMSKVLTPDEFDPKPYSMSAECLNLSATIAKDIYFTQYQICSALAVLDGGDASAGICENLGKKQASDKDLPEYSFQYTDAERAGIKKSVSEFRVKQAEDKKKAAGSSPAEVAIPDEENPLTILRFRLFYETRNYKDALTILSNNAPKEQKNTSGGTNLGAALSGVNLTTFKAQESKLADMVDDNMLEWYQEFFLSYPQHLQYTYMKKQLKETTTQFDRMARVMDQLRYKLPNSSVDGDKNKGK
ncbi:MAG: hypothetical protein ACK4NC_03430 [Candidatus Gracilibacteria bacterium]